MYDTTYVATIQKVIEADTEKEAYGIHNFETVV